MKISKENVSINRVENTVEILEGNLLDKFTEKADIIVCNIIAEVIIDMVKHLKKYLKDDGVFIASGIIVEKKEKVKEELVSNGFKILEEKITNDWVLIVSSME